MAKRSYWVIQTFEWVKRKKPTKYSAVKKVRVPRTRAAYMGPYKTWNDAHRHWNYAEDRDIISRPLNWRPSGKQKWTTLTGKPRKRRDKPKNVKGIKKKRRVK